MKEVLLKELSNSDIDWLIAAGHRQEIDPGTILIRAEEACDRLYILLEGTLSLSIPVTDQNPLTRAFAAIESVESSGKEIARLSSGEVIGEIPFVGFRPMAATVQAVEKSTVISIPLEPLATKLRLDVGFAARFYRAIAILFSDRLQNAIARLGRTNQVQGQPLKDVLCVLGDLNDSDIDWLMGAGEAQRIPARTVLIREGGPVDALYIILSGTLSMSISEDMGNPLTRAFAAIEGNEISAREIARLSKGDIAGETPFIDSRLPSTTIKTLEDSLLLSIPRHHLAAKLQQDVGFACRFYRVIATLVSDRLQGMLSKFGYGRRIYSKGQTLNDKVEYEDELNTDALERMALAGTRFDWMLSHLSTELQSGRRYSP
ncbi:MAG: cyclic nucleotide-binding domain-containing protein [Hydrococcus sp. Prado102]|jgi:bacteriocin-type transport-associated protein|nr:cyclic nucleotide-binding domain-containing protein [Hydrococcus sp. Prado102]